MKTEFYTHKLSGCSPIPLACYLKALGILRLISEQVDENAQGWWEGELFHLKTHLTQQELCDFFVNCYIPSPVVAPWNGGSGFFPKDNKSAIDAIATGDAKQLVPYRNTIAACHEVLTSLAFQEKPDANGKEQLLVQCRSQLPDEAINWLDAAFVLTSDGPKYPPLLGTGGNDGRLEFTNNFMQRLLDLIDPQNGQSTPLARSWWEQAFFNSTQNNLQKDSILGQFDPGAMDRPVNPCDFVLMIEGALVFAAATVKRHESNSGGTLSYPFSVRTAGIGYGSSASADEDSSRAEIWMPLWQRPCSSSEMKALFSEGRAQLHGRPAKNGVDFARCVATLGIDRGICEFIRYGFQARNGLAYFAVPIGRFKAEPQPQVNLLMEIDSWLDSFRRAASSNTAPASAQRALRRLESAILELCQHRGPVQLQAVLISLAEAEEVLSISAKWRAEAFQRPVPLLSSKWLIECDDHSHEFRLAASLAGIYSKSMGGLRHYLEPVEIKGASEIGRRRWAEWSEDSSSHCNVVWNASSLEDNLLAVLQRRAMDAVRLGEHTKDGTLAFPDQSSFHASLGDVTAFIAGHTQDARILSLTRGLTLLDWTSIRHESFVDQLQPGPKEPLPDATYSLLKLCHTSHFMRNEQFVKLDLTITKLATAGRITEATQRAARRLRGSSLPPAIQVAGRNGVKARRAAAALLFPIRGSQLRKLAATVLTPEPEPQINT